MFDDIERIDHAVMKNYTTLHVGGEARWFLLPKNVNELKRILMECEQKKVRYFILGNGSNLLVSDEGYKGAVVSMQKIDFIELLENNKICVGSGVNLFKLNKFCLDNELGGLEWCYGIPASVGGACKMNAGAYNGEFCAFVECAEVLRNNRVVKLRKVKYTYRKGFLKDNDVLISVTLKLERVSSDEIKRKQDFYLSKRKESQPYKFHSLGSVFKRGRDFLPAKLIQEFGLKGTRKGDICISMKHAGFIINKKNGRAKDFLDLVKMTEDIANKNGYHFEREFISIGFEET